MSQKLIGIVLVCAVVGLGAYFALSSRDRAPAETEEDTAREGETVETNTTDRKMAFADFMRGGGSYECSVSHSVDDVSSEGVVYINDDMVRADYTTTVNGSTIDSHSIMRDGYSYSWSSMSPTGFKVALVDTSAHMDDHGMSASGDFSSFDPRQIGDYECDPWTVNASVFAVPADIEFTDMTELMPSGQLPLE